MSNREFQMLCQGFDLLKVVQNEKNMIFLDVIFAFLALHRNYFGIGGKWLKVAYHG